MDTSPESPESILDELRRQGIKIVVTDGELWYRPTEDMTDSLKERIAQHQRGLIALLMSERVNWPMRVQTLLASCPNSGVRSELRDTFEHTALRLRFVDGLDLFEAEKQAFGQVLFRLFELGIDVRVQ